RASGPVLLLAALLVGRPLLRGQDADLVLHHGKIVTADGSFSIAEAIAVKADRILKVGSDAEILKLRGPRTRVVDLGAKAVLPGIMDSHVPPGEACLTEFDHAIPEMENISDVLDYIRRRAAVVKEGDWIELRQVFITRLAEQRYPTREELDRAAPKHPVVFATGPDASLNTLALRLSAIDRDFKVTDGGPGYIEKDPKTGEPTGILRSCTRYVKSRPSGRQPDREDRKRRMLELFDDYLATGLTSVGDRDASEEEVQLYRELDRARQLRLRASLSHHVETIGALEAIEQNIRKVAADPLVKSDGRLKLIGIKTYLDGGMLTGSAYMRAPWGVSKIYSITDPAYRGVLF